MHARSSPPAAPRSVAEAGETWAMPALLILAALSAVAWWSLGALGDFRLHLGAFYAWYAVAFAAYLLALSLVSQLAEGNHNLRTGWLLGVIFSVAIFCRAAALPAEPVFSDDIFRYQWDGRVQKAGIDPYRYAPNAAELEQLRDGNFSRINFPHLRTIYPPLTERAFWLVSCLRDSIYAQKLFFVLLEGVLAWSLIVTLRRRKQSRLWVLAYAWHPLAILEVAGSGHNDVLAMSLLWLGIAAAHRQHWADTALGWTGAFLSKFVSIVLAPWWFFQAASQRWLLGFLMMSAAGLALHWRVCVNVVESLSAMTPRSAANTFLYPLIRGIAGPTLSPLIVLALWSVFILWWARRQQDVVAYLLGVLAVAALITPALHPWYVIWMVPCFCFFRVWPLIALTATVALTYTVWPGYLSDGSWVMPVWARALEFIPVVILGAGHIGKWPRLLSFPLATKPTASASS